LSNLLDEFNAAAAPAPTQQSGNTVMGFPEPAFRTAWIAILSRAMLKSGKGFRTDTPNHRPPQGAAQWRGERRSDKEGTTKLQRRLMGGA
jgi:hypothetical protein